MDTINALIAVRAEQFERYRQQLSAYDQLHIYLVASAQEALGVLADHSQHTDIFVLDNSLGKTHLLVNELRHTYPRLLIVLVDEEADFAMPGSADDITTEPFTNDDLMKRINRLLSERRVETLRSDSLPAVRAFAKHLRTATGLGGKQQAAVEACKEMGYDYVAYYRLEDGSPPRVTLKAQVGPNAIQSIAPKESAPDDLMTWVAQSGQSRIAAPPDKPNHPLVARGRLGAVACVPVMFNNVTYGVMVACRDKPNSITQENVLILELLSAQFANALSKETS
jgi:GAF domain-containing protein